MSLILKYDLGNPHRLPVGYTPLAYIESSGTLRIDTNIVMNSNIRIDAKIEIKVNNGILWGTNSIRDLSSWARASGYNWRYGELSVTPVYTPVGVHHIILDSNFVKIDRLTYNYSGTFTFNSLNIQIFSVASGNSYGNAKYKLYFFKLIENNQLVRDFIPAKDSSGVIGLFDCVSQTFFTNQGTGEFIAGPEVVVLPYEYLLVEYVGNQYINNNLIPCYCRSNLLSGIYDITNNTFLASSGILGPTVEESSRQLEYNNVGSDYIGKPTNVHHSISNPSSTLINLGSGEFDGTSSIIIADSPSENVRSASFWINANSSSDSSASVIFVDYKSRLAFGKGASGNYYISCGNVNTAYYSINSLIGTNSWKHIVVINNGDSNTSISRKLYVNGVLLLSSGGSSYWEVTENKLNIGLRSLVENKGFDGKIYDFRLYDHALTADEVLNIYKGGL